MEYCRSDVLRRFLKLYDLFYIIRNILIRKVWQKSFYKEGIILGLLSSDWWKAIQIHPRQMVEESLVFDNTLAF